MSVVKFEWEKEVGERLYDLTYFSDDLVWVRVKEGLCKMPLGSGGQVGRVGIWDDWGSTSRGPEGALLTTDARRLRVMTDAGGKGRDLVLPGQGRLWGVTYCKKDDMYVVSDSAEHALLLVNRGSERVRRMGTWGGETHQFKFPYYLSADQEKGEILVSDKYNSCIKVFSHEGEFIRQLGEAGAGDAQLSRPCGICTDTRGRVVVCDYGNGRVVRFWWDGGERWDILLTEGELGGKGPVCVSMSPDGKRLAVGLEDGVVKGFSYKA